MPSGVPSSARAGSHRPGAALCAPPPRSGPASRRLPPGPGRSEPRQAGGLCPAPSPDPGARPRGGGAAGPRVRSPAPARALAQCSRAFPGEDGGGRAGRHHGRGLLRERGRVGRRGGRRPGEGGHRAPPTRTVGLRRRRAGPAPAAPGPAVTVWFKHSPPRPGARPPRPQSARHSPSPRGQRGPPRAPRPVEGRARGFRASPFPPLQTSGGGDGAGSPGVRSPGAATASLGSGRRRGRPPRRDTRDPRWPLPWGRPRPPGPPRRVGHGLDGGWGSGRQV